MAFRATALHENATPHSAVGALGTEERAARRILLLNYEYPPLGGGAGVASAALAQRLASRGVIVDIVTSRPDDAVDSERRDGLPCVPLAPALTLFRVRSRRRGGRAPLSKLLQPLVVSL